MTGILSTIAWAFVALVAIAALYDLTQKAIKAWAPKALLSTGQMIDNTLFAAQLRDLKNDVNALKVTAGFKAAALKGESTK